MNAPHTAFATALRRGFTTPHALLQAGLWALAAMLFVPFQIWRKAPPIPSFHGETAAVALGLLALTAVLPCAGRLPLPRALGLILGFVALLLLQILLGMPATHQHALLGALYLLWAAGLCVLAALLRRQLGLERTVTVLAWSLFAGALTSSLIVLAQELESYAFLGRFIVVASKGGAWGNLAQPNHLADYLTLGLVSLAYLHAVGRLRPVYALVAGLFALSILSLTGSRTPWLYLGTLLVLAGAFFATDRSREHRRLLVVAAAGLLAFMLLAPLLDLLGQFTSLQRPSLRTEVRPRLWYTAWLLFLDAPVLGQGFRQFGLHNFLLNGDLPPPRVTGFTDHAHNLLLTVMAEFGLAGLALLLAGALLWAAGLVRQPRSPALWWVCAIAAVLAIHSLLEYPLWYAFFLGPAALVLGLGEAGALELRAAEQRPRRARLALAAVLVLGWVSLGQVFRDYLRMENFAALRYKYLHATPEMTRSAMDTLLEMHRNSLLAPWVELGLARSIQVSADGLRDKLTVNASAMRALPIDDVVYRQAMLLALAGDASGARRQWDRAVASFPSEREVAELVLRRRVEDGLNELRPLLEHAQAAR
ncbi:MAG TPA: Wzy polymerase domain-containing protein [Burkholderiales bacterium]|nr:Wzy polymerase domain-containing protein [Burkholderiales bacterium]